MMRRNDNYILRRIAGVPYLLPTGQLAGDFRPSVQINETGAYLWDLLKEELASEDLAQSCARYYGIEGESLPSLRDDIAQFTSILRMHGILQSPEEDCDRTPPFCRCLAIAGLKCLLYGPEEAFSKCFDAFTSPAGAPSGCCQRIEVLTELPPVSENGRLLLRNPELSIIDCFDKYVLLFPAAPQIVEAHLAKDGSRARFYCLLPYTDRFREDLFHAIRLAYLYFAQRHGIAALHSASILYRGRAWLFSAPSGTGKSTHTNLWRSLFGTPVLNGDLNLLSVSHWRSVQNAQSVQGPQVTEGDGFLQDLHPTVDRPSARDSGSAGKPLVHGLPWCGTSGIYDTHTYPLGGIILLKQAPENRVESLPEDKKRFLVLQRLISPAWTGPLLDYNLQLSDALAEDILICRLLCTPDASAVETVRREIDRYLDAR